MPAGELDKRLAHERRVAAERAYAEDVARYRRRRRGGLGALALVGVGALVAGALAGGVAFVGGLAVLGGVVSAAAQAGNPPNKPVEQARRTQGTTGGGPFIGS